MLKNTPIKFYKFNVRILISNQTRQSAVGLFMTEKIFQNMLKGVKWYIAMGISAALVFYGMIYLQKILCIPVSNNPCL
jgi:hypothetical protein